MKKEFIVLLFFLILISLTCEPNSVDLGKPSIVGSIHRYFPYWGDRTKIACIVKVNGTRLLPVVSINGDTLNLDSLSSQGEYLWNSEWSDSNFNLNPGDTCELKVFHSSGEANAVEQFPGDVSFLSPVDSSIIYKGSGLSFVWTKASPTDRYIFNLVLYYYYFDTIGNWLEFDLDTTITILDTSQTAVNIPAEIIFPDYVTDLEYGEARAQVLTEKGPMLGRVIEGNLQGEGIGYFWTQNSSKNLTLSILQSKQKEGFSWEKEPLPKKLLRQRMFSLRRLEDRN